MFPADTIPTEAQDARSLLATHASKAGISNPGLSQDDFLAYVVSQILAGLPEVVDASSLPTADPAVAGQLWSNAGVVTVSAG